MTPEQQKAIALASARRRRAQAEAAAQPAADMSLGGRLRDNIIGTDDGVDSMGEKAAAWLNRAGESMTLGVVGDEAAAAADSMVGRGGTYDENLQKYRQQEGSLGTMGKLSADIAGALVPGAGMLGAVGKGGTLAARMGRGAMLGAAAGGIQGYAEGEGGIANRADKAMSGILGGGVVGGAVPALATLARGAWSRGAEALANRRIGQETGQALGVNPRTGRLLSEMAQMDDPNAMRAAMDRAGPDAMLAEAGPTMSGALDASIRAPGPGARTALGRIDQRATQAMADTNGVMNQTLGVPMGQETAKSAVRQGTAAARSAAYGAAYAKPIDYSGEAGMALEGLQGRLPGKAVAYANELMRLRGEKSPQIMAQIGDNGSVTFQKMPDVRQWDYIKQALDQLAESGDGAGALGGQTRLGSAYQSLARDVRDNLASAVPEYRTALDTASDAISQVRGVDFGTKLLQPSTSREAVRQALQGATKPEIAAIRQGVRTQIDEVLANVRAVASDQNVDPRQAVEALRQLSSEASQDKLKDLLGDQWPALKAQIEQLASAAGLRARMAANSATAGRLSFNDMMDNTLQPGLLRQGKPVEALKEGAATMMGASRAAVDRLKAGARADLADVLTRPGQGQQALSALEAARARNTVSPQSGSALQRLMQMYLLGQSGPQGAAAGDLMRQPTR